MGRVLNGPRKLCSMNFGESSEEYDKPEAPILTVNMDASACKDMRCNWAFVFLGYVCSEEHKMCLLYDILSL